MPNDAHARDRFVVAFADVGKRDVALVGGKGANLGELSRAGFPVPPGICVTTAAWHAVTSSSRELDALYAALDRVSVDDAAALATVAARVRAHIASLPIPAEVERAIVDAFRALDDGQERAYAVRSSATAEDLPGASFAGQQDTYLNVVGERALLEKVRACWASLFTDRAIAYRAKSGFEHRKVALCVVVQRQIAPVSAGIAFTADPVDGRRHIVSIDAGFGLGEALVSGLVNADLYKVDKRTRAIVDKKIGDKRIAIVPVDVALGGGTKHVELGEGDRTRAVLDDDAIGKLVDVAVRIEAHDGSPQDIEWCIDDGGALFIVQARPITTLFPIPRGGFGDDPGVRVFASFGHVQVMTDAMKPFGLSLLSKLLPFGRDRVGTSKYAAVACSRLYMDLTDLMRIGFVRALLLRVFTLIEPALGGDVAAAVAKPEVRDAKRTASVGRVLRGVLWFMAHAQPRAIAWAFFKDAPNAPRIIRAQMDRDFAADTAALRALPTTTARYQHAKAKATDAIRGMFFRLAPAVLAGGLMALLVRKLSRRDDRDADIVALARGLDGNVTTEMDLLLGDLADRARTSPVAARVARDPLPSLEELRALDASFADAFARFLDVYGVRGGGEIDVTRPRFADDPRALLQVIRGNLAHENAGAHRTQHKAMRALADEAAARIVDEAPAWKRPLLRRLIARQRGLVAVREHPKLALIRLFSHLRTAALEVGRERVARGELEHVDDVWFLTLDEAARAGDVRALVDERRAAYEIDRKRTPPRVITSDGEIVVAKITRELPAGALAGTGASAGVVDGVARVILDPTAGALHAGEILVAPFTDPGWTPLFINAKGLVMEVGGMMTHGSVVAREYGIPAVVSVDHATTRIKTGQRIRVDGTNGVVEILG